LNREGTWSVVAFLVIAVCLFGLLTNWSYSGGRTFLDLDCGQDQPFDAQHRCTGHATPIDIIHTRVNSAARSVLISQDNPKDGGPIVLKDCAVIDDDNWNCELPAWGLVSDPVHTVYGVADGRYFSSVTSNNPPNFYHSSLGGLWLLLYRTHALTLDQAARRDGFVGVPLNIPSPPSLNIVPVAHPLPPPDSNSADNSTVEPPAPITSAGDRPATVAVIEAHGGRWIGGKLFYATCPPGVWVGSNRLPPLKDLCPPPTTNAPATP